MATRKTTMPYVKLGNSGLKVSKIILGTMQYGVRAPAWPWVLSEEEGIQHIKAAYVKMPTVLKRKGVAGERILGKAIKVLKLPRDEIVVMTKLWAPVGRHPDVNFFAAPPGDGPDENGYVNQHGLSRKNVFESVKHSLERLQLDYIDLLQCHRFDYNTPIEETMQALHDVVKAGYVRYIGMSSCYAYQFHAMQNYAINNKLTPFISMQNHYSLLYREEEREMMPTLKHFGVGCIPWSPLARGLLTRPLSQQTKRGESDWGIKYGNYKSAASEEIVNRVEEVAKKKGLTMAQVALAWCYSKPAAVNLTLTDEEVKYLEEPYQPRAIFGHS
ncbi:hypothetical protein Clacol_003156 [Clathrus columnatus]|uniref:NADP-dependent oxidoreductase domain-containing protein n=1 Tax=Clathrus columnatus TaxID=1419009 RepID=A0AAV5A7F4_9AGAM|nr:hypothetical protein Clacol_003156 [Clathrus columnatus]